MKLRELFKIMSVYDFVKIVDAEKDRYDKPCVLYRGQIIDILDNNNLMECNVAFIQSFSESTVEIRVEL